MPLENDAGHDRNCGLNKDLEHAGYHDYNCTTRCPKNGQKILTLSKALYDSYMESRGFFDVLPAMSWDEYGSPIFNEQARAILQSQYTAR